VDPVPDTLLFLSWGAVQVQLAKKRCLVVNRVLYVSLRTELHLKDWEMLYGVIHAMLCKRSFIARCSLDNHSRVHTRERPLYAKCVRRSSLSVPF
jgi:hypothetical protein